MPGPPGVPRADIIALLQEGHSNRYIGRTLRTNPKRAGRIRAELGLPQTKRLPTLTLEQKWRTFTRPADDGHLEWVGSRRGGTTPVFMHCGRNYMARRVAFRLANRREPVGRVLPGCDYPGCIAPAHVEDQAMRTQYTQIFGAAS